MAEIARTTNVRLCRPLPGTTRSPIHGSAANTGSSKTNFDARHAEAEGVECVAGAIRSWRRLGRANDVCLADLSRLAEVPSVLQVYLVHDFGG
jgi:hypothetical protein